MDSSKSESSSEAQRTNVLLEELNANFKFFGDDLSFLRVRVTRMEPRLEAIAEDVAIIKPAIRALTKDMAEVKSDVAELKRDMIIVKVDVKEMRGELRDHDRRLSSVETRPA